MNYFLSYVEVEGHAAMMLSFQEKPPYGAVKIVYEAGYGYDSSPKEAVFNDEHNASRALYSSNNVSHKTYQISEVEAEQFFHIVNRQKMKYHGGAQKVDDFRRYSHNCKRFSLNVFKEIGIKEALNSLENVGIQRPGSTKDQVEKLSKNNICCPLKDEFIENFKEFTIKLDKFLSVCAKEIEPNNSAQKLIKQAQAICKGLDAKKNKVGITKEFISKHNTLGECISSMKDIAKDDSLKQDHYWEIIGEIKQQRRAIKEIYESSGFTVNPDGSLGQKSTGGRYSLDIQWKGHPTVSPRDRLNTDDEFEQAKYLIKMKTNNIASVLGDIEILIEKERRKKAKAIVRLDDLYAISKYIQDAKNTINVANKQFLSQGNNPESYLMQEQALNNAMSKLKLELQTFKPKSSASNVFIRMINKILKSIFKSEFLLGSAPENVIHRKLRDLQQGKKSKYDSSYLPFSTERTTRRQDIDNGRGGLKSEPESGVKK